MSIAGPSRSAVPPRRPEPAAVRRPILYQGLRARMQRMLDAVAAYEEGQTGAPLALRAAARSDDEEPEQRFHDEEPGSLRQAEEEDQNVELADTEPESEDPYARAWHEWSAGVRPCWYCEQFGKGLTCSYAKPVSGEPGQGFGLCERHFTVYQRLMNAIAYLQQGGGAPQPERLTCKGCAPHIGARRRWLRHARGVDHAAAVFGVPRELLSTTLYYRRPWWRRLVAAIAGTGEPWEQGR
jgi:hypothetical protein